TELRRAGACLHRGGPVLPQPAHGVGKNLRGVLAIVTAVAPGVIDFVASELEGALHFLVDHPPVAGGEVQVVLAVLDEHTARVRLILGDQRWIVFPAAQSDVGANGAEDTTKGVGPLPRRREGTDGPAAGAADAAIVTAR